MKKSLLLLLVLLALSCKKEEKKKEHRYYLKSNKKEVQALFNGQLFPFTIVNDNLAFPYTGKTNKVGFVSKIDSVKFDLEPKDSIPLTFIINEKDSISVLVIGKTKRVDFTENYIKEHKGKYKVLSPKALELVNVGIALTNVGREDVNLIFKYSDYYKDVLKYFDAYKNHPLIDSLNVNLEKNKNDYYYNIIMNANMYSFEGDKIVNKTTFNRMGFGEDNYLKKLLPLFEDFSKKSNFQEFYGNNEKYYQSLIAEYHRLVPVEKMWKWLEEKFPVKHDSYKIYFSPLVNGYHSTQKYEDNGFKETAMHINAPILDDMYSDKEKEAILSRVVFTEIDHNYVDPTTDKFNEISTLLTPLSCWNSKRDWYNSSYRTFSEYMTWGVFTLYLYDNFDKEVFEKRNEAMVNFMISENRGFIKFKEFDSFILNWYKNNPNASLEKLYPAVIDWVKKQNCKS
ncbi:DUF4932 domain-containing protein [uncultured Tenacibaculum sp.]|uniref:DUF4932 domain-containing protein n=1 Tax=uncultured Tenacibaculum sp. TaxID=174713 RepID=UPI00261C9983|nr:DUF4932 domain-containing protein [uncultured Tenacibaculum sp.]